MTWNTTSTDGAASQMEKNLKILTFHTPNVRKEAFFPERNMDANEGGKEEDEGEIEKGESDGVMERQKKGQRRMKER